DGRPTAPYGRGSVSTTLEAARWVRRLKQRDRGKYNAEAVRLRLTGVLDHQQCNIVGQLRSLVEFAHGRHQTIVQIGAGPARIGFNRIAQHLFIEEFTRGVLSL